MFYLNILLKITHFNKLLNIMLNQVLCYAYLNQVVLRFRPSEFLDQFFYLDQSSIFDHFFMVLSVLNYF